MRDCGWVRGVGIYPEAGKPPIVRIISGMVPCDIVEAKLWTLMGRVKTAPDFIDRPIAFILFCIILIVLGSYFWRVWQAYQKGKK